MAYYKSRVSDYLARSDDKEKTTLDFYLTDIRDLPLLTREQEIEYGKKISAGDKSAVDSLVKGNLRLVIHTAKKFIPNPSNLSIEDLIAEGNVGLVKAAERYDYTKDTHFSTYAVWWIRQSIHDAMGCARTNLTTPNSASLVYKRMLKDFKKNPQDKLLSVDELARKFGTGTRVMKGLLNNLSSFVSLDSTFGDSDELCYEAKWDEKIEETFVHDVINAQIPELLSALSPREKGIISSRYGLFGKKPLTLEETGKIYGITRERVRQIEKKALEKMKPSAEKYFK